MMKMGATAIKNAHLKRSAILCAAISLEFTCTCIWCVITHHNLLVLQMHTNILKG